MDRVYYDDIPRGRDIVPISAKKGFNMDGLLQAIETALAKTRHHVLLRLPYAMGGAVETLHNNARIKSTEYTAEGIEVDAILDDILYGRYREYVVKEL